MTRPFAEVRAAADRPNILWLSAEDISAHLGCYGDPHAITPHLDALAREGVRYTRAFTTAGVCAPCRSGIITGLYQTSLGTHHMRCTATLPEHIKPFPVYLRRAGYYCANNQKQDYQFTAPADTWDESSKNAHWRKRKDRTQPFFAVFNFTGCHESGIASAEKYARVTSDLQPSERQNAAALTTLPPYYADTATIREDWKRNYELITAMDVWAGELIRQLKDDGLYENTIIMFWSDHGVGLPRAKRWLYDSGTHIPLVVRIPKRFQDAGLVAAGLRKPGSVTDQLVSSIDFGPTVLSLAGVNVPDHVQGQPFLGLDLQAPREYVYGARDRMDERYDIIRMVRDKRFKYIRNYEPLKTFFQYMNTPEQGATMAELRRLHEANELPPAAAHLFSPQKSVEELYDCNEDPHEVNNLAGDPRYVRVLSRLRAAQLKWVQDTKDLGLIPEPIIARRRQELGSEYAILRQQDGDLYNTNLGAIASAASEGIEQLPSLLGALTADDSAIRYWGATGLGNIGAAAKDEGQEAVERLLHDESSAVRTAAARALCRMGRSAAALPTLIAELRHGAQWERLYAANVLDEIDEAARPVLDQMRVGLEFEEHFNSDGKYRVRVINRALNELLGTSNKVR
ncbi:MAG: sulfatase-like hydrolase/transferase [Planctomycetaceae bacterium]